MFILFVLLDCWCVFCGVVFGFGCLWVNFAGWVDIAGLCFMGLLVFMVCLGLDWCLIGCVYYFVWVGGLFGFVA